MQQLKYGQQQTLYLLTNVLLEWYVGRLLPALPSCELMLVIR